eukprot:Tbor_TRINITY_DN5668_c0_g2::TRINITY_DN5668_c0_g2_i15::g.9252::m.9252
MVSNALSGPYPPQPSACLLSFSTELLPIHVPQQQQIQLIGGSNVLSGPSSPISLNEVLARAYCPNSRLFGYESAATVGMVAPKQEATLEKKKNNKYKKQKLPKKDSDGWSVVTR